MRPWVRGWQRADYATSCGYCSATINRGDPLFAFARGEWSKARCPACAGEAVPADLPPFEPPVIVPFHATRKPRRPFSSVQGWARDVKEKQAGS